MLSHGHYPFTPLPTNIDAHIAATTWRRHAIAACLQGVQEPLAAAGAAATAAARSFSSSSSSTDGTVSRGADGKILPHGSSGLVDLMLQGQAAEEARSRCQHQVELTERQACDVELLTVRCAHGMRAEHCKRAHCMPPGVHVHSGIQCMWGLLAAWHSIQVAWPAQDADDACGGDDPQA